MRKMSSVFVKELINFIYIYAFLLKFFHKPTLLCQFLPHHKTKLSPKAFEREFLFNLTTSFSYASSAIFA